MSSFCVIVLLYISSVNAFVIVNNTEEKLSPTSQQVLVDVINRLSPYTWGYKFSFTQGVNIKFDWLLKLDDAWFMYSSERLCYELFYSRQQSICILFVFKWHNIIEDIKKLSKCYNSTSNLKSGRTLLVVVVVSRCRLLHPSHCFPIFEYLWSNMNLLNVAVLNVYIPYCPGNERVFMYDPFVSNNTENFGVVHMYNADIDVFRTFRQRFSNMNGYPVRVSLFQHSISVHTLSEGLDALRDGGVDASMLYFMSRHFNFTPIIKEPEDGDSYGIHMNNTFTGSLREVYENKVDFALNARFVKLYTDDFHYTFTVYEDSLCVYVKRSDRISGWDVLMTSFEPDVWLCVLIIAVLSSVLCGFFYIVLTPRKKITLKNFNMALNYVWLPLMSIPSPVLPKQHSTRIVIVCSYILSLIVSTLTMGHIYHMLKAKVFYSNINTLEQLDESGIHIVTGYAGLLDTFDGKEDHSLKKKLIFEPSSDIDLFRILKTQNVGVLLRKSVADYQTYSFGREFDYVHTVKECPKNYHLAYITLRSSPFVPFLNRFVLKTVESGMVRLWYQNDMEQERRRHFQLGGEMDISVSESDMSMTETAQPFSIHDLELAFFILDFGLSVSAMMFIIECVVHKICRRCKRSC